MHDLTFWQALGVWLLMTLLLAQAALLTIGAVAIVWTVWDLVA